MNTEHEWIDLKPVTISGKVVKLRVREGQKRQADHAPHVEIEATCGDMRIVRNGTIAAKHDRTEEHFDKDLDFMALKVAEEIAGHDQSHFLLKKHREKHAKKHLPQNQ